MKSLLMVIILTGIGLQFSGCAGSLIEDDAGFRWQHNTAGGQLDSDADDDW
ncbi:MAG: hypothetical protein ISS35_04765 [Kiritimatiellae bacterium]|nr:hypothetical protein [Kiritimatiellia bacterium]